MSDNHFTSDGARPLDRRSMLRMTSGALASAAAFSGAASANNGNGNGNGGGKSGGRGQTSDLVELDRPFEVRFQKVITTNASCNSDNSADQEYNRYEFRYCDETGWNKTFCVIPDDSRLNEDRVYEFHSAQDCKGPSSEFQTRFSFGPTNNEHTC